LSSIRGKTPEESKPRVDGNTYIKDKEDLGDIDKELFGLVSETKGDEDGDEDLDNVDCTCWTRWTLAEL
jgi:hypothetical protein